MVCRIVKRDASKVCVVCRNSVQMFLPEPLCYTMLRGKILREVKIMTILDDLKQALEKQLPYSYLDWERMIHSSFYSQDRSCLEYMATKCTDAGALHSMLRHGVFRSTSAEELIIAIASNKVVSDSTLKEIFYDKNIALSALALETIAKRAGGVLVLGYVLNKAQDLPDNGAASNIIMAVQANKCYVDFFLESAKPAVADLLRKKRAGLSEHQGEDRRAAGRP